MLDRREASRFAIAVILMHADRNVRVKLDQTLDQFCENDIVGISAGAAARLNNDGRFGGGGRRHDRETLLHVIDIKGRDAMAMLGRVVKQLAKGNAGHGVFSVTNCGLMLQDTLLRGVRPTGYGLTGHAIGVMHNLSRRLARDHELGMSGAQAARMISGEAEPPFAVRT